MSIIKIPVEVSARHIHVSQEHLETLFGAGYQLKKMKDLSQPSDFAAEETVKIVCGGKSLENVRIVGPVREKTQVEISLTDVFDLGINAPFRNSGDLMESAGAKLIGPDGEINLEEGVIIAKRHIHATQEEADILNVCDGDLVSVEIAGERGLVFHNVLVRIRDSYKLTMHIDTDEANAAGIPDGGFGIVIR